MKIIANEAVRTAGVVAILLLMLVTGDLWGQSQRTDYPRANVDFGDFKQLVAEVEPHRRERLIDLDTFLSMSREPDVIVLDARSKARFDRVHIAGARHLNFSDFTQERLGEVIPSFETTVLIYCNNNFEGNQEDFPTKVALPLDQLPATGEGANAAQPRSGDEALMMALNVPTYISLYGYGYRNVYELDELVSVDDPRIQLAGSTVASLGTGGD